MKTPSAACLALAVAATLFSLVSLPCHALETSPAFSLPNSDLEVPPPALGDNNFGAAMAASGDRMIIGAPTEGLGHAFIYRRPTPGTAEGPSWILEARLCTWPENNDCVADIEPYFKFGSSVTLTPEFAIVGSPGRMNGSAQTGAERGLVVVFRRNVDTGAWAFVKSLAPTAEGTGPDDQFGAAVAMDGPYLAVGAPNHGGGLGAVYVYEYKGDTGSFDLSAAIPGVIANDRFGCDVSISGEYLLTSSCGAGEAQPSRVFIIKHNDDGSATEAVITPDTRSDHDHFGTTLLVRDETLAVSSPGGYNADKTVETGEVFVFDRDTGAEEQRLTPFGDDYKNAEDLQFGKALALSRRFLVVGAPGTEANPRNMVFVYERAMTQQNVWQPIGSIALPDSRAQQPGTFMFGTSVTISEDERVLFIGEPNPAATLLQSSGRVHGYNLPQTPVDPAPEAEPDAPTAEQKHAFRSQATGDPHDNFGFAMASDDDMLAITAPELLTIGIYDTDGAGNGAPQLISQLKLPLEYQSDTTDRDYERAYFGREVALIDDDEAGIVLASNTFNNSVHVFLRGAQANIWAHAQAIPSPAEPAGGAQDTRFGSSITITETADDSIIAIIGASGYSAAFDKSYTGAVFTYKFDKTAKQFVGPLDMLVGTEDLHQLGSQVEAKGNLLVIASETSSGIGEVQAYLVNNDGMIQRDSVSPLDNNLDEATGARFGASIAISDDRELIVVGAPNAMVGIEKQGTAFVFIFNEETGVWSELYPLELSVDDTPLKSQNFAGFGSSVSIEDDLIAVGVPGLQDGMAENLVIVYKKIDGHFRQFADLFVDNPNSESYGEGYLYYGAQVMLTDNDKLFVSAPNTVLARTAKQDEIVRGFVYQYDTDDLPNAGPSGGSDSDGDDSSSDDSSDDDDDDDDNTDPNGHHSGKSDDDDGLGAGVIVMIVLASLIVIGLAIWCGYKSRQRAAADGQEDLYDYQYLEL